MLTWDDSLGDWEIDLDDEMIPMCGPGWKPLDLEQLWPMRIIRGSNEELPGVDGQLPGEMFTDQLVRDIHFQMNPSCDQDGTPHPTRAVGARLNMAVIEAIADGQLRDSLLTIPASPDYIVHQAPIQVRSTPPSRAPGGALVLFTLTVTVPSGLYVPAAA